MAVEELRLDDKPATLSTQALAATNFKGPLRGGTGNFVNKATDLELKKLRSCIQNEKILRQKAETQLRQNEKMAVRLWKLSGRPGLVRETVTMMYARRGGAVPGWCQVAL